MGFGLVVIWDRKLQVTGGGIRGNVCILITMKQTYFPPGQALVR